MDTTSEPQGRKSRKAGEQVSAKARALGVGFVIFGGCIVSGCTGQGQWIPVDNDGERVHVVGTFIPSL